MDGWNTSFLLGWPIFRCYVSFWGCKFRRKYLQTAGKTGLPCAKIHPKFRPPKKRMVCNLKQVMAFHTSAILKKWGDPHLPQKFVREKNKAWIESYDFFRVGCCFWLFVVLSCCTKKNASLSFLFQTQNPRNAPGTNPSTSWCKIYASTLKLPFPNPWVCRTRTRLSSCMAHRKKRSDPNAETGQRPDIDTSVFGVFTRKGAKLPWFISVKLPWYPCMNIRPGCIWLQQMSLNKAYETDKLQGVNSLYFGTGLDA